MYIGKERKESIAQVGELANALLVQYICGIQFNNQQLSMYSYKAVWDREQVPSQGGRELVMKSRK
jgi:hypothetical protein